AGGADHADDLTLVDVGVDAVEDLVLAAVLVHLTRRDGVVRRGCAHRAHRPLDWRRSMWATSWVSGSVMTRYIRAAITNGVALASWETPSLAKVVSSRSGSAMPAMKSSEVSLMMMTSSLVSGGVMIRKACGRTTETIVHPGLMPRERAASTWPFGTAWMPARIVSAM